ncbi:MAG TPA: hypothetical protein VHA73_13135 [Acidimicrobiales bacterium]|jgi:hypothetical protein|nr:hypothetical protein [Acidimicrobiales bacterium]
MAVDDSNHHDAGDGLADDAEPDVAPRDRGERAGATDPDAAADRRDSPTSTDEPDPRAAPASSSSPGEPPDHGAQEPTAGVPVASAADESARESAGTPPAGAADEPRATGSGAPPSPPAAAPSSGASDFGVRLSWPGADVPMGSPDTEPDAPGSGSVAAAAPGAAAAASPADAPAARTPAATSTTGSEASREGSSAALPPPDPSALVTPVGQATSSGHATREEPPPVAAPSGGSARAAGSDRAPRDEAAATPGGARPAAEEPWPPVSTSLDLVGPGSLPASSVGPRGPVDADAMSAAIRTLSSRVDALAASSSGLRSAFTDRLEDHTDTVSRLVRNQADEAEERVRNTDRSLAELVRAAADGDDALHSLSVRIGELETVIADMSRRLTSQLDSGRELAIATDKLSRQVVEGLDLFGDRMLDRIDELDTALGAEISAGRAESARIRKSLAEAAPAGSLEGASLASVPPPAAQPEVVRQLARLHDDLGGLASLSLDPEQLSAQLADIQEELAALRHSVADQTDARPSPAVSPPDVTELRALLEEVHERQLHLSEAADGLLELREVIELVPIEDDEDLASPAAASAGLAAVDLEPVQADLAALRNEVGELRRAAAALDADLASWRADSASDVDPAEVAAELSELRNLIEASGSNKGLTAVRRDLAELRESLEGMRQPAPAAGRAGKSAGKAAPGGTADAEALEALRTEIAALRRRLNLKARPSPVALDDEQLDRLADAVTKRLRDLLEPDASD